MYNCVKRHWPIIVLTVAVVSITMESYYLTHSKWSITKIDTEWIIFLGIGALVYLSGYFYFPSVLLTMRIGKETVMSNNNPGQRDYQTDVKESQLKIFFNGRELNLYHASMPLQLRLFFNKRGMYTICVLRNDVVLCEKQINLYEHNIVSETIDVPVE